MKDSSGHNKGAYGRALARVVELVHALQAGGEPPALLEKFAGELDCVEGLSLLLGSPEYLPHQIYLSSHKGARRSFVMIEKQAESAAKLRARAEAETAQRKAPTAIAVPGNLCRLWPGSPGVGASSTRETRSAPSAPDARQREGAGYGQESDVRYR